MLFLDQCTTLMPAIRLIKFGIIPLIQIVIIVALIIFLIIDFGKAVMAGKEEEIKTAQKLAIKRIVYAIVVFLVPWLVSVAFGLLTNPEADSALSCYINAKK